MKVKHLRVLSFAGLMTTYMSAAMSAPDFTGEYSVESGFLNQLEFTENYSSSILASDNLQLAQADTSNGPADAYSDTSSATSSDKPAKHGYTKAEINEMINNPVGELWILWTQNDTTWYDGDALDFLGEDKKVFNTTSIMPVMPFQLTEEIKYIFRPVIPIHSWDAPSVSRGNTQYPGGDLPASVDFDRQTELGDIVLWNALGTNSMVKPPNVFALGVTVMLDTATDDVFGTGKNSAGPMALAFHLGPPKGFIIGAVAQHWWSFNGDDDRQDVNMTNIQYVAFYRLNAETNIGFGGPNITANWEADSGNVWTVPVGLGWNTTTNIGPLPVKVGFEAYKYIEQPDNFGAEYGLRLIFSPVIPSPAISKRAIFGG